MDGLSGAGFDVVWKGEFVVMDSSVVLGTVSVVTPDVGETVLLATESENQRHFLRFLFLAGTS